MIKRLFYRYEHADKDDGSASSSSDSEQSEVDAEAMTHQSDDDSVDQVDGDAQSCSTSSGYESEDDSANEEGVESPGSQDDEADDVTEEEQELLADNTSLEMHTAQTEEQQLNVVPHKESIPIDLPEFVLKCKSVFKCRLCPKVVCLSEETLTAHIKSKRHARSEKQLKEGRLKAMLNDKGEIENDDMTYETPNVDVAPPPDQPKRKMKERTSSRKEKGRFRKKRKEDD